MAEKVLFVDDEENVLNALKRQFRKQYEVSLATSGEEALKILANDSTFSVIVSDMQMPEMNGVQFLQAAQKLSPDSVRLMLTGNADQQTAINAVNYGSIFSFYTKPCPPETMLLALEKAIKQHKLITAEKELLEGTLNGSVKLLMDLLSMVSPDVFTKTLAIREMIDTVISSLVLENRWNLKLASMLSNIACVTLPPETLMRLNTNADLTNQEKVMVKRLPEVAKNLVSNIPRLENVANILLYQNKDFCGSGFPDDGISGDDIPYESRVLKIIFDIQDLKFQGYNTIQSLKMMANNKDKYDQEIFKIVAKKLAEIESSSSVGEQISTTLSGLQTGFVLVADIKTVDGKLLVSAGHKITDAIIERLINYNHIAQIKEPIQMFADCSESNDRELPAMAI